MNKSLVGVATDPTLLRIRAEYLEMPGLRLTREQAQRLWGLDADTCLQFLELLTSERFLDLSAQRHIRSALRWRHGVSAGADGGGRRTHRADPAQSRLTTRRVFNTKDSKAPCA